MSTPRRRRHGTPSPRATTGTWLPRRSSSRTRRSASSGSSRASGSSTSRQGRAVSACRPHGWEQQVLATDWSPAMIERFEARVREEGLRNAEGRVMDCHALDLPDDSFDVTGSQFGVMLVPDQPRALREMVRVTKPGGRVLVIAYGSPGRARVPAVLHRRAEGRRSRVPRPPRRSAAARVPGVRSGGPAPAADRCGAEGRPRRANGRAASVRLGAGDVGLGAVRQPDPGHARRGSHARTSGRDCARSSTACSASAPAANGRAVLDERGQHRHRDEVTAHDVERLICSVPLARGLRWPTSVVPAAPCDLGHRRERSGTAPV